MRHSDSKSPKTVLVVEDDYGIRSSLQEALESENYRVVTAANGVEGLSRIREEPVPCLVLLDMMMPVMNGREFLDAVLADKDLSPIPVLVVSAIADRGNTAGARGFLKKPVDLEVLFETVAQYACV
jgi:CheY-like chemotaxis protein